MAKYNINYSKYKHLNEENLQNIYFKIKETVNKLLLPYNDNNFVDDPSVDIRTIAMNNGIIAIKDAVNDIEGHANVDNSIISLKIKDSEEEKRFSIAHDLKHDMTKKSGEKEILVTLSDFKKPDVEETVNALTARYDVNSKSKILKHKFTNIFKIYSRYITALVSENFVKKVSKKKAHKILDELYKDNGSPKPDKNIFIDAVNKLYDEEISDYFAANLLVPTERFILWEDKSDSKIAKAFKVPIKCIKKRREEIQFEIRFTTLNNLINNNK